MNYANETENAGIYVLSSSKDNYNMHRKLTGNKNTNKEDNSPDQMLENRLD